MRLQKLTYGSVFNAVEFANQEHFHLLSLKKKKQELDIVKEETFSNVDSLFTSLKGIKHLFLILTHEQVLTKQVHFTHIARESVVKTAFPNISINDFYYEVLDNGMFSLVSICRKEVVDKLIVQFREKGISVVQFSLGDTCFQKLLPFLNDFQFHTSSGVFDVENHKVRSWSKSQGVHKTYHVNGLTVPSNQLLPLAGIISYCNGVQISEEDETQKSLVKEYQQRRIFQVGLRVGLGSILVLLLINFFVFSSYRSRAATLEDELTLNEVYKKQLVSMTDLVSRKKMLVESMNSVSNSKVIWYVDQIAQSVPKTILLNQIQFQPVVRSIKKDKSIVFQTHQILVEGISKDDTDFTHWTDELGRLDWIEKVAIKSLEGESTRYTHFDFIIQIKP